MTCGPRGEEVFVSPDKCLDVPVLCGGQILTLKRRDGACETTLLLQTEESRCIYEPTIQ